jgi:phage virion morphogenesis protein
MAGSGASMKWGGFDKALNKFQDALANQKKALLEACGDALVSGTLKRFQDEEDPQGQKWAPVARSGKILTDTARLRNSIDSAVAGDTVLVGSNVIYALIHQEGGVIKPVNKKSLKFKVGKGKGGKWVSAKQVTIKARPYLGISTEDWQEIGETISDFIGEAFR